MNEFKTYHPIVNFVYFFFTIAFSCFFMHPVMTIISFMCAFIYAFVTGGKKTLLFFIRFVLPMMIITAVVNPLFNHQGITIITYLPNLNPLTAESVIYGIFSSFMFSSVILYFSVFNKVITSDKIIYLFGKVSPSLALIFSMTLRFIPLFTNQFKKVMNFKKVSWEKKSIIQKAKEGLSVLSVTVTWSLENAFDTSLSMQSRGYRTFKRTAYSPFVFHKRDFAALTVLLISGIHVLFGVIFDFVDFSYFPFFKFGANLYSISIFISYFVLCIFPVFTETLEVIKWKSLKRKI